MKKESLDFYDIKQAQILFGFRLKEIRKKKKIKTADMERDFPLTKKTIYNIEQGSGSIKSVVIYLAAIGETKSFFNSFYKDFISRESFFSNQDK
jgi:transcriptional regulator with XRE-family HTH domain